jgi:drug/metabolite transporter (DMT)-like permease
MNFPTKAKKTVKKTPYLIYCKLVLTMVIWGGTFIAGRIAVQDSSVFSIAFLRFAIAALLLLAISKRQNQSFPKLTLRDWLGISLMGLTGIFAYNAFFLGGLKLLPASRASLIVALNPIAIALSSAFIYRELLSRLKIVGILTSLIGVSVILSKGHPIELIKTGISTGDLLLFGCVASWVSYTLIGKQVLKTIPTLTATTYSCLVGSIALLPIALYSGLLTDLPKLTFSAWVSTIYMGAFGTVVAFLWYSEGIQTLGTSRTAIFTNLVPVCAVLMGVMGLGEPFTGSIAIGGTLVISGVLCTNLPQKSKRS